TAFVQGQRNELQEQFAAFGEAYQNLTFLDEETAKELNRAYEDFLKRERILSYSYEIAGAYEHMVQARLDAEAEGQKHWRQFITIIPASGAASAQGAASSWNEGVFLDALERAARNTEGLNIFLTRCAGEIAGAEDAELKSLAASYLLDPAKLWDEGLITRTLYLVLDDFYTAAGNVQRYKTSEELIREEISSLGRAYDIFIKGSEAVKKELAGELEKISAQEELIKNLGTAYSLAAEDFAGSGAVYDHLYSGLKESYADMEEKRFLYEIQDAIRRWASTAYLEADTGDAEYCADRFERALIVLEAVSDLYHQNEERRPYENSSYEAIYQKYQESFSRMIASMKVQEELNKAIAEEIQRNTASYNYYRSQLDAFGKPLEYAAGYTAPSSPAEWSYRDFLTVKNGRLGFSYNSSFVLQGINQSGSNTMRNYFSREHKSVSGTETNAASDYETALRELDRRMLSYFSDSRKYQQWGLARDYLIRKLLEMNPGVSCLQGAYSPAGELKQGGSLGGLKPKALQLVGLDPDYYIWKYDQLFQDDLSAMQKRAWENMSAGERADLEFYIVLTLFDDAGRVKNTGFSQLSAVEEFKNAQDLAQSSYESSRKRADMWWFFGFLYYGTRDENKAILDRVNGMLEQTEKNVDQWQTYLNGRLSGVSSSLSSYLYSCNRLSALQGKKTDGQSVSWNDIRTSLSAMGSVTDREMELLRDSWEMMNRDIGGTYQNVSSAIARLTQWTRSDNEDNKRDLEYQWNRDALDRQEKENNYLAYVNAFIAGEGDAQGLKEMAALAFGKNAAARKNHLENLEEVIIKDLAGVMVNGSEYPVEYHDLANSYASLISRAYRMRYEAELAARETEWAQQREDINEKYRLWQETAGLILERGREAWKTGNQKMAEAYRQWAEDYSSEYHRISGAWAAAYLAGLEDKETWLAGAAAAAEKASSRALLNLIGADAEMMARTMDTRDPAAMSSRYTTVAAEDLLKSLLDTAGISGLSQALASINGMADTAVRQVRRGTGGLNVWNSGAAQAAAMNLARETNAELAAREAKRLAADAQAAASEAIRGLAKTVDNANGNFREKMDEIFIMRGFWRGDGKNYIRDIFVHSTVFQPVITEQATVQGYVNYQMEPVEIKTNVSESYLSGLNAFAIQGLIENVHKEVETATKKIFGDDGEENTIIKAKGLDGYTPVFETDEVNGTATITWIERWIDLKDREQSPGKFGAHIGYAPAQREDVKEVTRRTLFYDEGAGELGRLLADFIYWQAMDSVGTGKIASAVWDKPLWDSRSSIFDAPSIRTITDIGLQVVTGVISMAAAPFTGGASALAMMGVMTAISVTDDLVFNTLDAVGGYKTWDEAGFAFGKAVLISAASNAVSGVFNGVSGVSGGFFAQGAGLTGITAGAAGSAAGKAVVQTAMKGMETITSTLVTSALNGVTYSRNGGWGYSTETFFQGVEGLPSSLLSGMTSTFTTGMMNRGLEGFTKSLYVDGTKLSGLAGSLAGQGVNYAMGGDFSMNLFNLGLVSQGKINSGLLELHLGRDGVRMNLGTGGADVSLGSLMAAARGLEAWAVNLDLLTSKEDAARKYASQMRTLYSGSETNKDEYLAILAGRTKILENPDVKETESKVDESTGVKNIALGQNALNDTSRFGLNVYFSHESYRDGLDNGAEQQAVERDNAVAGHINTAIDLMQTYGAGSIGAQMALEANLFSFAGNNGITGLQRAIFDMYDSSADYWKVTKGIDGSILKIENDDSDNITFVDESGNVTSVLEYTGGSRTEFIANQLGLSSGAVANE
ncbi:MAG: hypothetical protein LBG42_06730, partial [Treponema sp.]|nr:hypothetical protein [Treponema sp.]